MDISKMDFNGAEVTENRSGLEHLSAIVLCGGVNPDGNIGIRVAYHGGGSSDMVFYPEFWETHQTDETRIVIFTRKKPNGDDAQFPCQPFVETEAVMLYSREDRSYDWMTRAEQRQGLSKFNLANASVVECWSTGRSEDWRVRQCEIGTGALENITFRLGLHGKGEKPVVLYDGFWSMQLNPVGRCVYFRRRQKNGKPQDFPNQPDEMVTGYMVRWKK